MDAVTDEQWLHELRSHPPEPPPAPATPTEEEPEGKPRRKLGLTGGLAAAAAVATILAPTLGGALASHPAPAKSAPVVKRAVPVAAPEPIRAADEALPFRSLADCPPGASNDARGLANLAHPDPWVCAYHAPGQTLRLTLTGPGGVEHSSVVTKFTIIPGVVGPLDAAGKDPWLEHRCVKWIRLQFNDVEHAPPIDLDTQCVRGEATVEVPNIIASQITMVVREATRPPTSPAPTQAKGDLLSDFVFSGGELGAAQQGSDPADGTFAVGGIKISGREATR